MYEKFESNMFVFLQKGQWVVTQNRKITFAPSRALKNVDFKKMSEYFFLLLKLDKKKSLVLEKSTLIVCALEAPNFHIKLKQAAHWTPIGLYVDTLHLDFRCELRETFLLSHLQQMKVKNSLFSIKLHTAKVKHSTEVTISKIQFLSREGINLLKLCYVFVSFLYPTISDCIIYTNEKFHIFFCYLLCYMNKPHGYSTIVQRVINKWFFVSCRGQTTRGVKTMMSDVSRQSYLHSEDSHFQAANHNLSLRHKVLFIQFRLKIALVSILTAF